MKKILSTILVVMFMFNIVASAADGIYTWSFVTMPAGSDSEWIDANNGNPKNIVSWGGSLAISGPIAKDISSMVEGGERVTLEMTALVNKDNNAARAMEGLIRFGSYNETANEILVLDPQYADIKDEEGKYPVGEHKITMTFDLPEELLSEKVYLVFRHQGNFWLELKKATINISSEQPPVYINNLSVIKKTPTSLTINWQPECDGSLSKVKYNVYIEKDGETTKVGDQISGTTYTIENLDTLTQYSIFVKPTRSGEEGESSNIITGVPSEQDICIFSTDKEEDLDLIKRENITVNKRYTNESDKDINIARLIIALYKQDSLVTTVMSEPKIISQLSTETLSSSINLENIIPEGDDLTQYKIKALLWDFDSNILPITKVDTLYGKEQKEELYLWYESPAPLTHDGWQKESLPLGNGWFGANVFGGVETERIQLTDKTLHTKYSQTSGESALTSFGELYMDFPGHSFDQTQNYRRDLSLDDAISTVSYDIDGVNYKREYFASYPDKVMAIKLSASENEKISFTLRAEVPFIDFDRTGTVVANGDTITMSGSMNYYKTKYEGQYKVIPDGGQMTASNDDGNGKITVSNANSVVILVALGTNYELSPEIFLNDPENKIGEDTPAPTEKITQIMNNATRKGYNEILIEHKADYRNLFSRVSVDLGESKADIPTDKLVSDTKAKTYSNYLDMLLFQYGRYLMIASSREGTMPANLQGTWNDLRTAEWTGGYWFNVNIQMNYWPVFSTNIAETFSPFMDYMNACQEIHTDFANSSLSKVNPDQYDKNGDNGWTAGTANHAYISTGPSNVSQYGTGPFMCENIWDYYKYTDENVLKNEVYDYIYRSSLFTSKIVKNIDGYGDLLLCSPSYSPEQPNSNGQHINSPGMYYDQSLIYLNHLHAIEAAEKLGIDNERIQIFKDQLDKLDPISVGWSGQIKEFRDERYYGDFGEYNHRHISQLLCQYPGNLINDSTPAWLDASKVTLDKRGDWVNGYTGWTTGWSLAQRVSSWARTKDGDRALNLYRELMSRYIANNLWNTNPPFQIDGNSGATAGVAEMLLQSHQGFIEPLPARPAEWSTGNYEGLVARGGFEVSAWWEDNQATKFKILSKNGEDCKLKYYNISEAKVVDDNGQEIAFTVEDRDTISFATTKGMSYKIYEIPQFIKTPSPTNLSVELNGNESANLTWSSQDSSCTYNVYKAIESSPTYTLIGENITDTSFVDNDVLKQATYKVVAVKNDRESVGITKTISPVPDQVTNAVALKFDGFIQLSWDIPKNTEKYNVYKKENGQFVKLLDTTENMAVINDDTVTELYVDSEANSRLSEKTAFEIKTDGYPKRVELYNAINTLNNVNLNKYLNVVKIPVTTDINNATEVFKNTNASNEEIDEQLSILQKYIDNLDNYYQNIACGVLATCDKPSGNEAQYPLSAVTDGDLKTRHYAIGAKKVAYEIPLNTEFEIDKITVQEFRDGNSRRTDECSIEIYESGQWVTVVDKKPLDFAVNEFLLDQPKSVEKIRVTCENTHSDADISIYEIEAWGCKKGVDQTTRYKWDFEDGEADVWSVNGLIVDGQPTTAYVDDFNGGKALAFKNDYNKRNGEFPAITISADTTSIPNFDDYSRISYTLYIPVECNLSARLSVICSNKSQNQGWIEAFAGNWSLLNYQNCPKTEDGKYYIYKRIVDRNVFTKDLTGVNKIDILMSSLDSSYVGTLYVDDIQLY